MVIKLNSTVDTMTHIDNGFNIQDATYSKIASSTNTVPMDYSIKNKNARKLFINKLSQWNTTIEYL